MVVLDDLQWADSASLDLLFHLGRHIEKSRILIVGTYRPDEVALGRNRERHPLEKILAEFKRYFADVWLDLNQAARAEGRRFVDALLDTEPNRLGHGFRQALFQQTGGNPLFTIELLRDMEERGDLLQDEGGKWVEGPKLDWESLPKRVEGVIEERIGRLEEKLRDILSVASVEGEYFTAQIIARVQDMQERQLLRELSQELEKRHRLVRDRGEVKVGRLHLSRYQFAHAMCQQYLYKGLGDGERRLLHTEIAQVLEELYAGHTEEAIIVRLAHHYTAANKGEKAIGYLLHVGDRARSLYANQEAIAAYQSAFQFLKEQKDYERAARTQIKLMLTYHSAFKFPESRQASDEAAALRQMAGKLSPSSLRPAPHALRVASPDPATLDPSMADDIGSGNIIDPLFSGLMERSSEMDVVPQVVLKWNTLDGGRTYVFHLRDDVRWSDGVRVTAGDFEYAWKRVLNPATQSPCATQLYEIKGARDFHQGKVSDPVHISVNARDESTLVVELEGPTSFFPHLLAYHAAYAVPRHAVAVHGVAWAQLGTIVTNGPFRLEAWQPGKSIVLSRNLAYHGQPTGNVQRVEVSLVADPDARLAMYEANRLDILPLYSISPAQIERVRQWHAGEYVVTPELATDFIGFDVRKPPFDNPRVRQAFAQAVDRETLVNVIKKGVQLPATGGLVPAGMAAHTAGIGLQYDPDCARRLLAEAGYPGGRGFPPVTALATDDFTSIPEYLQAQWSEILGVKTAWEIMKWAGGRVYDRLNSLPPSVFVSGWLADYPDPDTFLRVCPFRRWTGWHNEDYVQLVEKARRVMDQGERLKLYRDADTILVQEAPIVPLDYGRRHWLVKPWVKNFRASAIYWWFWQDVIIEPH